MKRHRFAVPEMIIACGLGCAVASCEAYGPRESLTRYDSAGVEVADNHAPAWESMDRWMIAPEPTVSIGARGDDSPASFSQIGGAFRDAEGRILALDLFARELRFFSSDGSFLFAAGGPGGGPGEFPPFFPQYPAPLYELRRLTPWRGDSIAVHGMGTGTLQILDAMGIEGRRIRDVELQRWPQAAWGADRILLTNAGASPVGPEVEGWRYDSLFAVSMDGSIGGVGVFPFESVGGPERGFAAPVGEGFITWKSHLPELRFHDWDGTLRRIARLPLEPASDPDPVQQSGEKTSSVLPLIQHLTTDHDGYLWFVGAQASLGASANALHVVSPDGQYLGEVDLPPRFFPVDIGRGWILGIWRDELDVEYLRLHALEGRGP